MMMMMMMMMIADYDKKAQVVSGDCGELNDGDSLIGGENSESITSSDCESAEWEDISESDLDNDTFSDLESQSFLPDGDDDISFPSDDELGDNCGSDSVAGLIGHFEPNI
jgi:hypothetical protein